MQKWFFMTSFICFAASDQKILTFDPHTTILAKCVNQEIVKIDSKLESILVTTDLSYLAARRFHGRSLTVRAFTARFNTFYADLRLNRICHKISQDQFSERLRVVLKKALINCGDTNSPSSVDDTMSEEQRPRKIIVLDKQWISFNPNRYWLLLCIEGHLKLTAHHEFHLGDGFAKVIADFAAKRYYGKSLLRKEFLKSDRRLFNGLLKNRISHNVDIDKLSPELQSSVRRAVEDCAENKLPLAAVPIFKTEPTETAQLLNLILVKWPDYLCLMIQSRNSRKILRRYANDALAALLRELNNFNNNSQIFRPALRFFWKNRAQEMYDAIADLPYIVHRYTMNYPTPHMVQSDFDKFINRKNQDFKDRNPFVPQSYVNEILNVHASDRNINESEFDVFYNYSKNGMTSDEYYLENQLNQFYRIIFFFLELCARGICTDEDDIYSGFLPYNLVPEQIQAIVDDDDIYRDYLLDERNFYKMFMEGNTQNEIAQNLFENARVYEENLILLRSNVPFTNGIQSDTKSPIETTIRTTTESLKRKDNVWKNENGKCFPKRSKTATFSNGGSSSMSEDFDTDNLEKVVNSTMQKNHTFEIFTSSSECSAIHAQDEIKNNDVFGYMVFNDDDDFDQLQFSYEELLLFQEISHIDFLNDEHCLF